MTFKEYLDKNLNKYYLNTLEQNGFEITKSDFRGMGAGYYFKNNWLNFNIINDRGIIMTNISSIYSKKVFDFNIIDAAFIQESGKYDLLKNLSLEQESDLFQKNIDLLYSIFNKHNYKQTELKLHTFNKERAKLIFD